MSTKQQSMQCQIHDYVMDVKLEMSLEAEKGEKESMKQW